MFMFHYYLRQERRPAWDALNRAQRWLLDPDRKAPSGMPADLLPQALDDTRVAAWAGFVHSGQ
jgi:hypothetical protein